MLVLQLLAILASMVNLEGLSVESFSSEDSTGTHQFIEDIIQDHLSKKLNKLSKQTGNETSIAIEKAFKYIDENLKELNQAVAQLSQLEDSMISSANKDLTKPKRKKNSSLKQDNDVKDRQHGIMSNSMSNSRIYSGEFESSETSSTEQDSEVKRLTTNPYNLEDIETIPFNLGDKIGLNSMTKFVDKGSISKSGNLLSDIKNKNHFVKRYIPKSNKALSIHPKRQKAVKVKIKADDNRNPKMHEIKIKKLAPKKEFNRSKRKRFKTVNSHKHINSKGSKQGGHDQKGFASKRRKTGNMKGLKMSGERNRKKNHHKGSVDLKKTWTA